MGVRGYSDGSNNVVIIGGLSPEEIITDTWGHLAPKFKTTYPGYIIFTQTEFGDLVSIKSDFENLDSSPWFFENLMDFIVRNADIAGQVYKFTGTYRMCKNGRGIFKGKIKKVQIN